MQLTQASQGCRSGDKMFTLLLQEWTFISFKAAIGQTCFFHSLRLEFCPPNLAAYNLIYEGLLEV